MEFGPRVTISHHHMEGAGWPCPEKSDADGSIRGFCVAPELWAEGVKA